MSTNTYLFSIKAFSIFDIFSAAYYYLYFSIFLFSESLSKMPRQAGDKRPRLDEDGDQEVLIYTTGLPKRMRLPRRLKNMPTFKDKFCLLSISI